MATKDIIDHAERCIELQKMGVDARFDEAAVRESLGLEPPFDPGMLFIFDEAEGQDVPLDFWLPSRMSGNWLYLNSPTGTLGFLQDVADVPQADTPTIINLEK